MYNPLFSFTSSYTFPSAVVILVAFFSATLLSYLVPNPASVTAFTPSAVTASVVFPGIEAVPASGVPFSSTYLTRTFPLTSL